MGTAPVTFAAILISTCQTPEIDSGAAIAETTIPVRALPTVIGRFSGEPGAALMAPVTGAGVVSPTPSRKILTTDPGLPD